MPYLWLDDSCLSQVSILCHDDCLSPFFCCYNKIPKAGYFIKKFLTVRSKSMVLSFGKP